MAKILIAEDELLINELLQRNLKPVGHICTPAFDKRSAAAFGHQYAAPYAFRYYAA